MKEATHRKRNKMHTHRTIIHMEEEKLKKGLKVKMIIIFFICCKLQIDIADNNWRINEMICYKYLMFPGWLACIKIGKLFLSGNFK
jgi:hypothetical protein